MCVLQVMSQVSSHREEMERSLQKVKTALDDTHQENTELISKVHTLLGGHQIEWKLCSDLTPTTRSPVKQLSYMPSKRSTMTCRVNCRWQSY